MLTLRPPFRSLQCRIRKFVCTIALFPGRIVKGRGGAALQRRRRTTGMSPVGGGGACRNCTATRATTLGSGLGPRASISVAGRFDRFRSVIVNE
jgi:hypothetical protein